MSLYDEPRICTDCGDPAPWQIEDLDGDGSESLARSCDDCLVDVLRSIQNAQPVVIEVIA